MLTAKKILAVVIMILSVVSTVISVAGVVGSWVVRARLETSGVRLLLAAEQAIATSHEGIVRVDGLLDTSGSLVSEVDTQVRSIQTRLTESEQVVVRMLDTVGLNLGPNIAQTIELFNQVEANIAAINEAAQAVTAIPLLRIESPVPGLGALQEIEDRLNQIRQDVQAARQLILDTRNELIEGRIAPLTDLTSGLLTNIETTQTRLRELDTQMTAASQTMVALRQRLPELLLLITVLLNIFLLLAILAFISLFLHARQYYRCTENGLRALLDGGCTPATS